MAILVLTIVLFVGPMIGYAVDGKIKSYYDFLKDFQTLLGGLFAIVAAYLTIGEMRLNELNSEKRHRDSIRMTGLGDQRRIERAVNPHLSSLETQVFGLGSVVCPGGKTQKQTDLVISISKNDTFVEAYISGMTATLEQDTIVRASKIFPGSLYDAYTKVKHMLEHNDIRARDEDKKQTLLEMTNFDRLAGASRMNADEKVARAENIKQLYWGGMLLVSGLRAIAQDYDIKPFEVPVIS